MKSQILGILLFLVGLAVAANGLHIIIAKPEDSNFYFHTTGTVIDKYTAPKCTGATGFQKCKDTLYIRYRYRSQAGDPIENTIEDFCINWEAANPGDPLYVVHVRENPRGAKACSTPIDDPYYARPWVYLILGAALVSGGLSLWLKSSAKKRQ